MKTTLFVVLGCVLMTAGCGQTITDQEKKFDFNIIMNSDNWNKLTPDEERVIENKGTELAWTGVYVDNHKDGMYLCKRCNAPLFTSDAKFDSRSGWPSFDECVKGAVEEVLDADGSRSEIVCSNCKAHLGHVFRGEGFTSKNTRHCVNSISLNFVPEKESQMNETKTGTAIFASGCFWGTEYFFEKAEGVISTQVGYIGGHVDHPTYKQVCSHTTGHAEAVKVVYDPQKTDYETLCKLFFETHDPTQVGGQGPDIGDQYRSEIFYTDDEQKAIAEKLKAELEAKGLKVATKITKATTFWDGEDYHEHYYSNKGGTPYCHAYTKRF